MRYSLRHILDNRFAKDRNAVRKMSERYVPLSFLMKIFSPYPTYIFLNLGLHPDTVTLISFGFIFLSSMAFIWGSTVWAIVFMLSFALLDSVDGDMARCLGPTKYGSVFDSFGADLFYALLPLSVGYHLFSQDVAVFGLSSKQILLLAALVSSSFVLYRLVNAKVLNFRNSLKADSGDHSQIAKESLKSKGLVRLFELYRHVLLRSNFFAEPGLIFWFTILLLFKADNILAGYLVIVLLYNLGYLLTNFFGAFIFFKSISR